MSSESDSPDLQKSKTFFQYGNDAAMKGNLDYAIAMYRQASKLVPDNMIYRQALRGVERKKFNNDPKSVSKLVGMKNQPLLMQAKSARSKGKFNDALELCEDAFANNPWDVGAARVAAEAAEGLGLGALSQWLIDSVQAIAKDADFFRFAGGIYETNESWAKAIACWEQVKKLNPNDQDVSRKINALSAASTIKRSGLDEALDQRAVQAKQDAAAPAPESMDAKLERLKQEQLTPEQRLVKEILNDPTALHAYVQLADIYRSRSDLEKAEKVLAKGLKANPNDAGLMSIYEDTQITRLKRAVQSQTHRAQENPDDTGAKVKLDELTEMLNKYQIQAYRRRTGLHPEDANLHFQFGVILAQIGKHDEAIGEFQQARSSSEPSLKIQALHQTGLSFEANNAPKLAERNYKEALKLLEAEDKENFKALHYRLGRVCESLGNTEHAEEHYNEVAAIDYTYLDVAERLRRLI